MSHLYDHRGNVITRPTPKKRGYIGNYYRGAEVNRYRTPLPYNVTDSNVTLNKGVRRRLLGYARWMYANSGTVMGAINDMARYSVGSGLKPQSLAGDVSQEYEEYFHEWAKVADVAGVFNFWQMQRLASIRMDVDGDLGFLMVSGSFPQLQLIESHVIESQDNTLFAHDGVRASKAGRPVAYSLKDGDKYRSVSANDFILVYDPDRVQQLRGMTALAHAADHIRDQMEILDYEKIGVKMNSAVGLAIKTEGGIADDGEALIESGYAAADTGTVPYETFEPGMVKRLRVGESIESFMSNRPNATFTGFIEHLTREVSLGLGLPYEFVVDPAKQGTASRFILEKAQRRFEERQNTVCSKLCNRVWGWVISNGIKRGDLPKSNAWYKVRWQSPKKITVDYGRESKAHADALKLGTRTLSEDAAERGQDWQDLRNQTEAETRDLLERAKRLSDEYGIKVDAALNLLSQRQPNPTFDNDVEPQVNT